MNRIVSAEFYKLKRCRPLWLVLPLYFALGFHCALYHFNAYGLYDKLELFALPTLADRYLTIGTTIMTAYVIGLDFSCRTVKNALSVGVDKRSYYLSRMAVAMLLAVLLYGAAALGFVCGRLPLVRSAMSAVPLPASRPELALFGVKLAVCTAVSVLQLLAYVSLFNAACYFIKRQLPAMAAGLAFVIAELLFRQFTDVYDMTFFRYLFDFAPVRVLKNTFDLYALRDGILTFGYLKFGLSALVIILVSSAVGLWKFQNDSENDPDEEGVL